MTEKLRVPFLSGYPPALLHDLFEGNMPIITTNLIKVDLTMLREDINTAQEGYPVSYLGSCANTVVLVQPVTLLE